MSESSDFVYNDTEFSDTSYGNLGNTGHRVFGPLRFTPASSLKWEIQLRGDQNVGSWNNFYQRPRRSFDDSSLMKSRTEKALTSNDFKSPEREKTSLPISYKRASSEFSCDRSPGCERSCASQWAHLIKERSSREFLGWATTLRGMSDVRTDAGVTEMLGKKKLYFKPARDTIIASDPKLLYMG